MNVCEYDISHKKNFEFFAIKMKIHIAVSNWKIEKCTEIKF